MTTPNHEQKQRLVDRWKFGLVAVTTLLAIGVSIVCLLSGWFIIFQNLFYIPIIIACIRYSKGGFIFSIVLAGFYFLLILAFTHDPTILLQALIRVAVFIMVAGVVAYLFRARTQAEKSLQKERDHLEELVLARTASLEEQLKASKHAEDALRESEERFRTLVEQAGDGMELLDTEGHYLGVNETTLRQLGYTREEILKLAIFDVDPLVSREHFTRESASISTVSPLRMESAHRRKDGSLFPVEITVSPVQIGGARRYLTMVRDITERKRAEEELARLNQQNELILNSAAEGILGLDLQGNHTFVNPAAAGMLGYEIEELLGRPSHSAWHHTKPDGSPYPSEGCEIYAAYRDGAVHRNSTEVFWRKDGTSFPVEYASMPIYEEGRLAGAVVTFTDITGRKRAEEALRQSEERHRAIIQTAMDGFWLVDAQKRLLEVNETYCRMSGYSEKELLAMRIPDLEAAETDEDTARHIQKIMAKNEDRFESRHRRKDGSIFDVEVSVQNRPTEGGRLAVFLRDVTERKRSEEALRLSEEKFEKAFRSSPDIIILTSKATGRIIDANDSAFRVIGYAPEEIIGRTSLEVGLWASLAERDHYLSMLQRDGRVLNLEADFRVKSGEIRKGLLAGEVIRLRDGEYILGVVRDITELKRVETALRERDLQFKKLSSWVPGMIYQFTKRPDGTYCVPFASEAITDIFGCSPNDVREDFSPIASVIFPEDYHKVLESIEYSAKHLTSWTCEYRVQIPGQPIRWMLGNSTPEKLADGSITWYGFNTDITKRKQTEAEVLRYQTQLEAIYDNAPLMMCLVNEQSEVERMNRVMAELAGPPPPEGTPRHPGDYLGCLNALDDPAGCGAGPQCRTCSLRLAMLETLKTGQPKRNVETTLFLARQGVRREVRLSASTALVRIAGEDKLLLCLEDITTRKQLEEQFLQAQKMEAVGQLAGGVAHDFNNILAAMIMHLHLLGETHASDTGIAGALKELQDYAERAASLTRQLLLFSRRHAIQTKRIDVNEVVDGMTKMLGRLLGEHIELTFQRASEAQWVDADVGMLEQVIMNLCVNARDAMSKGGRLTFGTATVEIGPEEARRQADARVGRFACLTLSDTGHGMDEATLKRIFEPFFTTKEAGKGTGLGLATVYGIVRQHQGWVSVESSVGVGTTFRVYLPLTTAPETSITEKKPAAMARGNETILLVEDEPALLKICALLLRRCGYRVLEAGSGVEGLRVWEDTGGQAHLVLTDMIMPGGIGGLDLIKRLRQSKPGLKAIITSGYSLELVQQDVSSSARVGFVSKPYEPVALARAVREALDEKAF